MNIASDGQSILISFEAKVRIESLTEGAMYANTGVQAPPELWKLEIDSVSSPLLLRHSFISTPEDQFAALASVFGGENDSLVMRAETCECPGRKGMHSR